MGILTVIPMAQLPFVLVDNGQGSARLVSVVLGVNFVFAAVSAMSFASFKIRFGKRGLSMGGLTCGMIGIAAMGFVQGLPSCVAAALAGLGTGMYNTYVFDHGVEFPAGVSRARGGSVVRLHVLRRRDQSPGSRGVRGLVRTARCLSRHGGHRLPLRIARHPVPAGAGAAGGRSPAGLDERRGASIRTAPSSATAPGDCRGNVLVSGSYGGEYNAYHAGKRGLGGVILNDAGVGEDGAGIRGLAYLDPVGSPLQRPMRIPATSATANTGSSMVASAM